MAIAAAPAYSGAYGSACTVTGCHHRSAGGLQEARLGLRDLGLAGVRDRGRRDRRRENRLRGRGGGR